MATYTYSALFIQQTENSKPMLLLSAPAAEIQKWAGIPQKKRFSGDEKKVSEESIGFQREENTKRINEISSFFNNENNVIQNPLLCATRIKDKSILEFQVSIDNGDGVKIGKLVINIPNYSTLPFKELLAKVKEYLESRVAGLSKQALNDELISTLKKSAVSSGYLNQEVEEGDSDEDLDEDSDEDSNNSSTGGEETDSAVSSLFEESHILEFWHEIAARYEVAKQIGADINGESFLGFTREALAAYIYPVVLVDGQHRLKGAVRAAREKMNEKAIRDEIAQMVIDGENPDEVEESLLVRESRRLPISLLMSADPAEQVFQFIVVNQKATPIGPALLGTIVSTTLSKDEMEQVADRLKKAGIQLESSQAVTYLARHHSSPFYERIETGVGASGSKDKLQWNVFSSLVDIFRNLRGGKLYGDKLDYAQNWKARHLSSSEIVADYAEKGFASPEEYWKQLNGPWRDVFIAFWSEIKRIFASDNIDAPLYNFWGKPRESNLFNKPSLTILAADFFNFLNESRRTISSASEIPQIVESWLEEVNSGYFNRDWNLTNVKKDSDGIKKAWATAWRDYRRDIDAKLPSPKSIYRTSKGA